jgi:hypothetical protein
MANVPCDMPALTDDSDTSDSDVSDFSDPSSFLDWAGGAPAPTSHSAAGGRVSAPASEFSGRSYHDFDSFPSEELHECCICLTTPTNGRVCQLHCSHVFHAGCIDTWLNESNTCPTCRTVVDPQRVMPIQEDSFPPGFPRNMNEFAQFIFGMGLSPFSMRAATNENAPPSPGPSLQQPAPVDEDRRRASVEALTGYLRTRSHTSASSAVPLENLAGVREIWTSLPPSMSIRRLVDSQPDVFHVVQQRNASSVYVDPQPEQSSNSPLSQCVAAVSSYLQTRGHTGPFSPVRLSVLCDVPAIRRTIPSNMTLSAVISSSPTFVLVRQPEGTSVFIRAVPRTAAPPSLSGDPATSSSRTLPSTNSNPSNAGTAIRSPESYNRSWETYAVAVHKHLVDCGFTSRENSLSLRLLGTVAHLSSLRKSGFPPLLQLLRHYPHLLVFDYGQNRQPRVWAITGFKSVHVFTRPSLVYRWSIVQS